MPPWLDLPCCCYKSVQTHNLTILYYISDTKLLVHMSEVFLATGRTFLQRRAECSDIPETWTALGCTMVLAQSNRATVCRVAEACLALGK